MQAALDNHPQLWNLTAQKEQDTLKGMREKETVKLSWRQILPYLFAVGSASQLQGAERALGMA